MRDRAFWVFIAIIVLVAALCGGIAIYWRDQIEFDPASVINDGVDFLIGLLSMIISFWVAEIYWKNKTERERTARILDQLNYYLDQVARIIVESSEALAGIESAGVDAVRLEQEVLANLRRLGDGTRNILRIIDVSSLELKRHARAAGASAYFRSTVAPTLERLSCRPYVRPEVGEIGSALASVGDQIDRIVRYLRGGFDESDPPWGSN